MSGPEVVLFARTIEIADLIQACAEGKLAFSGPDSLHTKIAALGFKTTGLYEMVRAAEWEMKNARQAESDTGVTKSPKVHARDQDG